MSLDAPINKVQILSLNSLLMLHLSNYGIAVNCTVLLFVKRKSKEGIAVCRQACHHRYGNSHAIWDHTVLPATRQR